MKKFFVFILILTFSLTINAGEEKKGAATTYQEVAAAKAAAEAELAALGKELASLPTEKVKLLSPEEFYRKVAEAVKVSQIVLRQGAAEERVWTGDGLWALTSNMTFCSPDGVWRMDTPNPAGLEASNYKAMTKVMADLVYTRTQVPLVLAKPRE